MRRGTCRTLALLAMAVAPASAFEPFVAEAPGLRFQPGMAAVGVAGVAAPAAAGPAPSVDLRAQFPDPPTRDQRCVGSCHDFGSVGLLEAAVFRQHGRRVPFSEQDLFIQVTVLKGGLYAGFDPAKPALSEGGSPDTNLRHALTHGVLTRGGYDEFVGRYSRYRDAEVETLKNLERQHRENGWLLRLFYDPRSHWIELQSSPLSRQLIERYLLGRDEASDAERARNLRYFHGMTLRSLDLAYRGDSGAAMGAAQCLAAGAQAARAIKGELDAGRPVVVSMTLKGLAAWGQQGSSVHANHAFVITGYSVSAGKAVLQTRNSWGGHNPAVLEEQLCRVYSVSSVLAKGERGVF